MLKRVSQLQFGPTVRRARHIGILSCWVTALACVTLPVLAQAPAGTATTAPSTAPVLLTPAWLELSQAQQESLRPLSATWDTLADGHKRKWLALAPSFQRLSQPEQAKMHARMAEWAALKPKEREQARLNFAETKKIAPADRAANWEAYQALTAEEKKELAQKARKKPPSAAIAVKPVAPEKLAKVAVTRRTPEPALEKQQMRYAIDRHTLLPVNRQAGDANTIESPLSQGPHRQ